MQYQSARYRIWKPEGQLVLYIVINGHGKVGVSYSYQWDYPFDWTRNEIYQKPIYLEQEGVKFAIFDYLPLKSNADYFGIMTAILSREGLDKS